MEQASSSRMRGAEMLDDDDDIEIIEQQHGSGENLLCQLCDEELSCLPEDQRQAHYEAHFAEESPDSAGPNGRTSLKNRFLPAKWKGKGKDNDAFWHPRLSKAPPSNFTPGLIPMLRKALLKSHARGYTSKAVLCHEHVVHISRDVYWDVKWGCGYRNYEMACTALMSQNIQPVYFDILSHGLMPGVRNLQQEIDNAWKDGFDVEGAEQLRNDIIGSNKWIGTGDIWVAFTYRGIPAKLVDFDLRKAQSRSQPVIDWVKNYFSPPDEKSGGRSLNDALMGASPVTCTDKMPLILQHQGHSVTVIGYELTKTGAINLLVFNPSKRIDPKLRQAAIAANTSFGSPTGQKRAASPSLGLSKLLKRHRTDENSRATVVDDDEIVFVGEERKGRHSFRKKQQQTRPKDDFDELGDPLKLLQSFREDTKKIGRKTQYQILYFPLTNPYTEKERLSRKVVTSTKGC